MKNENLQTLSYEDYISMLDSEEKQKIKEIFELFDKNLDGGIDIKELKFILNCKISSLIYINYVFSTRYLS
jgi:Ca2+-binding EF-hand superfamily protein